MSLSKAVISLVVVGLVATAFAATEGQESLTFAEWSANAAGSAQIGTQGSYFRKSANVKHLCLKENQQYGCRYVGCAGAVTCPYNDAQGAENGIFDCPTCFTHVAGLSDVECCNDQDYYPKETTEDSTILTSPPTVGKVGTCDWDADLFTEKECATPADPNTLCGLIELENGAFQIGTAWATCYLNAGSEECGHPFCDRMVLSFQGGMYAVPAYSKTNAPLQNVTTDGSSPWVVPFPVFGNTSDLTAAGCFVAPSPPVLPEDLELGTDGDIRGRKASAKKPAPKSSKAAGHTHQAALNHSLNKKLAGIRASMLKKGAAHKHTSKKTTHRRSSTPGSTTGHEYYNGIAIMMSGAVTVTSLDKHVEYSHGLMEYVPLFSGFDAEPIVGKPSATALVVKPNTYNIQLVAGPKGEGYGSKGAEEYKGDAGKGYYKGGEGQGY